MSFRFEGVTREEGGHAGNGYSVVCPGWMSLFGHLHPASEQPDC